MKLKVVIVDLAPVKRWSLRIGIPLALLIGGSVIADASVPVTWDAGQTLTATDLNADFASLQPFVVEYSGGGSVPALTASTWVALNFPTKTIDNTPSAVSTTSSWIFTVPASGNYRVMARVCIATAMSGSLALDFYKNGAPTNSNIIVTSQRTSFSSEDTLDLSDVVPLTMGDTLGVAANALNGATLGCGNDRFRVAVEGPIPER